MQAERGRAGRHQDGGGQGNHRRGDALLLRHSDRYRRYLSQVRLPHHRVGRGAARHHLPEQVQEVHRVNGTMINQNDTNAELITKLSYKTVAVIHDTTDYGKGHNQYFSEALGKLGGKIVGTFGVTADQQDFTAELTQIKALNPQVIYFGGLTPIGVRIRSQMDKLGIKAVFDGTSGIVSDAFIQGLGPL